MALTHHTCVPKCSQQPPPTEVEQGTLCLLVSALTLSADVLLGATCSCFPWVTSLLKMALKPSSEVLPGVTCLVKEIQVREALFRQDS